MDFLVTNRKIEPIDNSMRLTVQRDTMTEVAVISFNRSDLAYFYQTGVTRAYAVYKPHGKAVQPPKICTIDETDTDRVVVTWEIDDTATQTEGVTEFQIVFSENDPTDEEIVSIWATLIYNLSIPRSLLAEDVSPEEPTPLIIEQMLQLANQAQDAVDSVAASATAAAGSASAAAASADRAEAAATVEIERLGLDVVDGMLCAVWKEEV